MRPNTVESAKEWIEQHHDKVWVGTGPYAYVRIPEKLALECLTSEYTKPEAPKEHRIPYITLGGTGKTEKDAWQAFWNGYDDLIKPGGTLYWRKYPEIFQEDDLASDTTKYKIICRLVVNYVLA